MRVYHFLKRTYGLEAIKMRHLKIARLGELNDPFEFMSFSMRRQSDRVALSQWKIDMGKSYGLLCFSAGKANPVQWAHYADNHRGICLGFDVPDDKLVKVRYVSRRGEVDLEALMRGELGPEEPFMLDAVSTKYSHWRYEAERRTFLELDHARRMKELYFSDFGPELILREVIVGEKSDITRVEIGDALGGMSGIEAYKARLAFRSFKVVRNKLERLWK